MFNRILKKKLDTSCTLKIHSFQKQIYFENILRTLSTVQLFSQIMTRVRKEMLNDGFCSTVCGVAVLYSPTLLDPEWPPFWKIQRT